MLGKRKAAGQDAEKEAGAGHNEQKGSNGQKKEILRKPDAQNKMKVLAREDGDSGGSSSVSDTDEGAVWCVEKQTCKKNIGVAGALSMNSGDSSSKGRWAKSDSGKAGKEKTVKKQKTNKGVTGKTVDDCLQTSLDRASMQDRHVFSMSCDDEDRSEDNLEGGRLLG